MHGACLVKPHLVDSAARMRCGALLTPVAQQRREPAVGARAWSPRPLTAISGLLERPEGTPPEAGSTAARVRVHDVFSGLHLVDGGLALLLLAAL